jgi:Ca2+-binding RTX toxin-like protein
MLQQFPSVTSDAKAFVMYDSPSSTVTILTGFGKGALVTASDKNTTVVGLGSGDITALFGTGRNIALGGAGNDVFIGYQESDIGFNSFSGGAGNDVLIRGEGINQLNGGDGFDTVVFGEYDSVTGGNNRDHFIFAKKSRVLDSKATASISDFSSEDALDLSFVGVTRNNCFVDKDGNFRFFVGYEEVTIPGVGVTLMGVGGIDAAIANGQLILALW